MTTQKGSTMYLGKAPLTVIRLTDGTRKNISAGAAVPESIDPADRDRLVEEGFLEEVELLDGVVDEDETVVPFDDGLGNGTPDEDARTFTDEELDELLAKSEGDILDEVGDDAVLAAAALARESSDDGKGRKGVSAGLQEVVDAAEPDETEGGQS